MDKTKLGNKQIGIIIFVAVIVIITIGLLVNANNNTKNIAQANNENNNEEEITVIEGKKLAEVKKYKGLEISNVKFEVGDRMTEFTADVTNNTNTDFEGQYVNINMLDENGSKITSTTGFINPLKVGETKKIYTTFLSNGKEAVTCEIELTEEREKEEVNNQNINNVQNIENSGI